MWNYKTYSNCITARVVDFLMLLSKPQNFKIRIAILVFKIALLQYWKSDLFSMILLIIDHKLQYINFKYCKLTSHVCPFLLIFPPKTLGGLSLKKKYFASTKIYLRMGGKPSFLERSVLLTLLVYLCVICVVWCWIHVCNTSTLMLIRLSTKIH